MYNYENLKKEEREEIYNSKVNPYSILTLLLKLFTI